MPTVAFKTLGCRLNQAETAAMAAAFESTGYGVVAFRQPADVVVVHTCTITNNAESEGRRLARALKRRSPPPVVVLAGCAVETGAAEALKAAGADILAGQSDKHNIPALVAAFAEERGLSGLRHPTGHDADASAAPLPAFSGARALIKVQDGCDFRCSYCIVPEARGAPRSRSFDTIVDEIRSLACQRGYREVVLTGANIGRFHDAGRDLIDLINAVEAIPEVERIRLSSIEPSTVERRIVDCMATSTKLCHTLHLPLQSGDNGILAAMRRRYTREQYLASARYALERIPRLGLGSDIVTGFPGESEESFAQTRALIESLPFSNLHVFPYSERPGTPAARMPGSVAVPVRKARAHTLIALGQSQRQAFAADCVGQSVSVLVERMDPAGRARGWTSEYLDARVEPGSPDMIGRTIAARVTAATADSLTATWEQPA